MSLSKGNVRRNRPQKHQNRTAFKNNLHDTSKRTKTLNSLQVSGVCPRCKEIIEWKIKYKKYKPLAAPRKCANCEQKCVKQAYHIFCDKCSADKKVCAKCCKGFADIETQSDKAEEPNIIDIQSTLKKLSERKRRTVLRYLKKHNEDETSPGLDELLSNVLKMNDDDSDFDSSDEED